MLVLTFFTATEQAHEKKKIATEKAQEIEIKSKEISTEKAEAEEVLSEAMPALLAAKAALGELEKADITEIRYIIQLKLFHKL